MGSSNRWTIWRTFPRFRAPFSSRRRRNRRESPRIPVLVDVLEDRTLLAAPTVVNPIDDITVQRDRTERVAAGLDSPLYVTAPPGDFDRLFIVEKTGAIRILDLNTGSVLAAPFLDLPGANLTTDSERGLLGLAFHPDYATNGLFYVNFTDVDGDTVIRRYQVSSGDPNVADSGTAITLLTFDQPFANHNGGWMDFGPDGFLYISSGDGGSGNDPDNRAQDINDLLGKILRIDVNGDAFPADPNRNYAIPADNPFVGTAGLDEIWAYGLRNPWRPSFDALTGDFYIADVGQSAREEVNFQNADSPGGENYGWRLREGTIATPGVGGPPPPGAIEPVYDYAHGTGLFQGRSVTGGYVYRGPIEDLQGQYIFGDFISSQIWSIEVDRSSGTLVPGSLMSLTQEFTPDVGSIGLISSFGEDAAGNLYVVDFGGEIFRVVPNLTETFLIDLSEIFSDPESDDTYTVLANSHPSVVGTAISGTTLRLSFDRATTADVEITIQASDPGGLTAMDTFQVSFDIPALVAVGADAGGGPHVRVFDPDTQAEQLSFFAYVPAFWGGVRVAMGDVNADGVSDVITAPGPGGGPHVRVFDGLTGQQIPTAIGNFFAYDASFFGGLYVAAADLDSDGRADVITAADRGGGPHIRAFSGADGTMLLNFFAYDPNFLGGVRVAAGDVDGDGTPDIITGPGPGGGPHVRVFDGETGQLLPGALGNFFAYEPNFFGGIFVSAADLDGDDRAEIITSPDFGGGPHVRIFRGSDGQIVGNFFAFEPGFIGGVRIAVNAFDGSTDVIAAAGPGGAPTVRIFDGSQLAQGIPPESAEKANFMAFAPGFAGGLFAGGAAELLTLLDAPMPSGALGASLTEP